jgi:hypothetical protein
LANTSAPYGFRQFGNREGGAPTAGLERRFISSANTQPIFTGDVVAQSSAAPGYIVTIGATGAITTLAYGVFQGCEFFNTAVNRVTWSSFWPGSGATGDVTAMVCSNPEQLYTAQGSTGAVLGTSQIGLGVPCTVLLSSLGNQTTGQSVMGIQSSLATGLSSNAQFMIVDLYSNTAPPGVNGTSTGAEGLQIAVLQPLNFVRRTITGPVAPNATILGST